MDAANRVNAHYLLPYPVDVIKGTKGQPNHDSEFAAALAHGAHVVVGTSGLTEDDYAEIDVVARNRALGVLAVGNFALTVVLMQKFAEAAARMIPT